MRLRERDKRNVTLCDTGASGDRYSWRPGIPLRAVLRPGTSRVMTVLYGERAGRMLEMLYDGGHWLQVRQGLCVEVGSGASCDYRIVHVERHSGHQRAHLAWIPEELRDSAGDGV